MSEVHPPVSVGRWPMFRWALGELPLGEVHWPMTEVRLESEARIAAREGTAARDDQRAGCEFRRMLATTSRSMLQRRE